jgi:hypothetical protein
MLCESPVFSNVQFGLGHTYDNNLCLAFPPCTPIFFRKKNDSLIAGRETPVGHVTKWGPGFLDLPV